MTSPLPGSTSGTARLIQGAPAYAVGWQEPVYVAKPAAGAGWSHTVDGRYYERLISVTFALTTSAVVANRFPQVQLTDTNNVAVAAVPAGNNVAASASLTAFLTLHGPAYSFGSSGGTFGFLPDLLVPPGWTWSCQVFGADAGDQLSGIVLVVQRFPTDTAAITAGE